MYYSYKKAMIEDIKNELRETEERDFDSLYDDFWMYDSITGNASGSYTFNTWKAKEYVTDNMDILRDALDEFCYGNEHEIVEHFINEDWDWFDVTIRCYLLSECLQTALDEVDEDEDDE